MTPLGICFALSISRDFLHSTATGVEVKEQHLMDTRGEGMDHDEIERLKTTYLEMHMEIALRYSSAKSRSHC